MKKNIYLFVLLWFISSCSQTEQKSNIIDDPFTEDQEKVEKILTNIFEVAKAKDMKSLDSYHLNHFKYTKFDNGDLPSRMDYATAKKKEEDFFTGVSEFNYQLHNTKVDVFGSTAISTFIIEYDVKFNDEPLHGKLMGTLVFVKDGEQWKIVHEHFSPNS